MRSLGDLWLGGECHQMVQVRVQTQVKQLLALGENTFSFEDASNRNVSESFLTLSQFITLKL